MRPHDLPERPSLCFRLQRESAVRLPHSAQRTPCGKQSNATMILQKRTRRAADSISRPSLSAEIAIRKRPSAQ